MWNLSKTLSTALDISIPPLMKFPSGLKELDGTFANLCPPMAVPILIFTLSLTSAHWANKLQFSFNSKTLLFTFNFKDLWDKVNVLTEDLFIGSEILFLHSGCILSWEIILLLTLQALSFFLHWDYWREYKSLAFLYFSIILAVL